MKQKGVSAKDLAEGIGVSSNTISGYNVGRYWPRPEILVAMANFLDVDVRELLVSTKETNKRRIDIHIEDENGVMRPWNEVIK